MPYAGKLADPEFRKQRARKARATQVKLTRERAVALVLAEAPEFSDETLAALGSAVDRARAERPGQ